jgi:hypothetical protein
MMPQSEPLRVEASTRFTKPSSQEEKGATRKKNCVLTGHKRDRVMSNTFNSEFDPGQPMVYQIRIKGHLDRKWADWFSGLSITSQASSETLLTGPVLDQAMLHGLLRKVRDAGLPLVAVIRIEPEQVDGPDVNP